MSEPFALALAFSLLAAAVALAGLAVIHRRLAWGRANATVFAAFAAGILITAALLHLVPEAMTLAPREGPLFLLAGYLAMLFLGQFIGDAEHTPHEERHAVAIIPLVGIGFHSLIDGVAYAVAFSVDRATGLITTLGLLLHEFPEAIIVYVLLLKGGFTPRRAFLLAALASAATTPAGMLGAWPFIAALTGPPLGSLLALVAGILVYVGASHLVPHVEHNPGPKRKAAFAAGIGLAALVILLHRIGQIAY
ncbi:MAG: ZIP family metal transporter [Alphaproteobacteria bacterium]|nr:MAG: ZIP family metal transporter [Alphaproteobacteria bacterium]